MGTETIETTEGDNEVVDNGCNKDIIVHFYDIEVKGPFQKGDYQLIVGELEMKEPYIKYKLDTKTNIIPLINLDLYGQSEHGKIIKIEKMDPVNGIEVTVSIPADFIKNKAGFKSSDPLKLYVYIDNKTGWVSYPDKNSGINTFERESNGDIQLTITRWPDDDRMIGCGN